MSTRATVVVGTAGHIDHGKTSLIRALTGVDLDSQPEEKARGITIALGFTPLSLDDGRRVAFVDVPGHERLVRTMIAGATGIDAALLCVSAIDGVMPQTREHLAILDLLGVTTGAVVLTKVDLVEDEELLELARAEVEEELIGTVLENAPILDTSAHTGRGLDALRALLATFENRHGAGEGPFRLPVDRSFVREGFGTVVTGTTRSGTLRDGTTATLLPQGTTARVRGLQVHGESVSEVGPGLRVAVNLAGIEQSEVPRGTVVSQGDPPVTSMLDATYRHLADAPDLDDGTRVRVLTGTTEVLGRVHLIDPRDALPGGQRTYVQLRLEEPVVAWPGDRFVVRRESPMETWGGGIVLDPWAPRYRKRHLDGATAQLRRLEAGDRRVLLERAGDLGLEPKAWRERAGEHEESAVVLGGRALAPAVADSLVGRLVAGLTEHHADNPLVLGASLRAMHKARLAHLPARLFDAIVERARELGAVVVQGPLVRLAGFHVALTPEQQALQERVLAKVTEAGLAGLTPAELAEAFSEDAALAVLKLAEADGRALQVDKVGWVARTALDALLDGLRAHFDGAAELLAPHFKELTGLTRKNAIPFLEWLDRQRYTVRTGDGRVRGQAL